MDANLYENILRELNLCKKSHVNDEIIDFLHSRYPRLPLETLRSIIGLWYTRKVAASSSALKDIDIYKEYKKLVKNGNYFGCYTISEEKRYPPALIAKFVLTGYLAENQRNKPKVDVKKVRQLRKPECSYCVARKAEFCASDNDTASTQKHNDPRVELALNLFDEDDEIGKYFIDKFKPSESKNTLSKASSKSNKFYWQASSFEQMGEKNVMKCKNIERLFANPNSSDKPSKENDLCDIKRNAFSRINTIATNVENTIKPRGRSMILSSSQSKRTPFRIKDLLNEFDDVTLQDKKNENILRVTETPTEYPPEYPPSPEDQNECTCNVFSSSDDSDSDSDYEEAWENVNVRELLENTCLIEDPILAQDVLRCTISDDQYGPTSDIIANSLGVRYERLLEEYVKKAGLPYRTENKLRGVGVDKTPDIILLVPVAVDGFVINWIESKALFADYKQHQYFKKSQFKNYTNRFGHGLVIYWHGYVDNIPELHLENKEIIVKDKFPAKESFTFVNSNKFKSWMQPNKVP